MDSSLRPPWQDRLSTDTTVEKAQVEVLSLTVPGLTLLAHPDPQRTGERVVLRALVSGREALLSRMEPQFAAPAGGGPWRPLADPHLSRRPLLLAPAPQGGVRLSTAGSPTPVLAGGEPLGEDHAFSAQDLASGVVLMLASRIVLLLHRFLPHPDTDTPSFGLIGESDAIREVRRRIRQVADLDLPVLLRGETGTGKELLAQAIHQASRRRDRPYYAINMGAVPASLAAAELFGAAKGAFTGADRKRRGYFSLAHGGTLFLDEIGEVAPEIQPLLLRALENGEIQPVGAEETVRVDVRTIAATDANLEAEIAAGKFRAPLLHRLSGYPIRLPPLRERRDDVARLFFFFLRQELEAVGESHRLDDPGPGGRPWLPAPFVARLAAADWPGNVRQLRNVARQLVVDSRGFEVAQVSSQLDRLLDTAEFRRPRRDRRQGGDSTSSAASAAAAASAASPKAERSRSPMEVSEDELVAALKANRWHPGATARQLGISRPALYTLIDGCPRTRKAADLTREEIEHAAARSGGHLSAMVDLLEVSEDGLKRQMRKLGLQLPAVSPPERHG
ncbi:MAG TPA: sigma-54 dependent transcriptional regulator [Thermoanaerobaculia bacterium]|nr:sigma-54 dependent transcriptional regulator [Thermoanaerobaculia bacterium]